MMEVFGFFSVPTWLLVLLLVLVTYYIYITWNKDVFRTMGVPVAGGTSLPILGHLPKYQKQGVYIADVEWVKKYGKVYGTFEGGTPVLVVSDTNMLKQILVKEFNNFTDRRTLDGLNGELEKALTVLKGEHWKHVRNIMTPTFSAGKLKRMMPLILRASECLVQNLRLKLKESTVQDLKRAFGGYTMDVIASTAFGIEVDSQSNPEDPLVKNATQFFRISFANLVFFPFTQSFLGKLGITFFPRSCGVFFKQLVIKILNERELLGKKEFKDFLQLMLDEKRKEEDSTWDSTMKGLSTEEIIAQSVLFLAAGYETTGTTLSLLAYNLALNQDKQEKLHEEVVEKLDSERPSYDNVHDLQYMEMCINETLRLFPPAVRFDRKCTRDIEIEGIKIPSGMIIAVPAYGIHHSPEFWDDPEEFKPERFSPEEKANINPFHYLPFGFGPRNCIGMRLAYLEMKVALADFVRNFHVSVCEKTKIPPNFQKLGILLPDDVVLKIEDRK